MYQYNNIEHMAMCAEKAITERMHFPEQVMVYVGGDPDVSGPSFVIDWLDHDGLELFRNFCKQMADHYKSLSEAKAKGPTSVE